MAYVGAPTVRFTYKMGQEARRNKEANPPDWLPKSHEDYWVAGWMDADRKEAECQEQL